jgi:hypothetical protein
MGATFLQSFIQEKTDNYIEPQREGTPRGEPIGLSLVKYKASLYILTNKKLKEIAKELEISYGLLRKWKTEKAFSSIVEKHREEFAGLFVDHARVDLARGEIGKIFDGEDVSYAPLDDYSINAKNCDPVLLEKIISKLYEVILEEQDDALRKRITAFTGFIDGVRIENIRKFETEPDRIEKALNRSMVLSYLAMAERILRKPKLTKEDRQDALKCIQILKEKI